MAIITTVSITEKTTSMSVTAVHLLLVQQVSEKNESDGNDEAYPESLQRELVRYKVTDNSKTQHKLAHIVTKLGKVVYLFLVHFKNMMSNVYARSWFCHNMLINLMFF